MQIQPRSHSPLPPSYPAAVRMRAASAGMQDTEVAENMAACDEAYANCFALVGSWLRNLWRACSH